MNKFILILAGLTALTVVSCRKEIEYKGDSEDPLVVVNSIMEADSVIKVHVEHSRFFLDPQSSESEYWITNATVLLTVAGSGQVYTQTTSDSEGNYVFPVSAQAGESYTVSVSHPDFPTVTSFTSVPVPVALLSVDTSSYTDASSMLIMKSLINWNDPPGKDFYIMKVSFKEISSGNVFLSQPIASNDPGLDAISASDPGEESYSYQPELYFNDEFFDGQNKTMDIRVSQAFTPLNNDLRMQVHLYRCTEETYKYLISVKKFQNSDGDIFSEPVKVFSNITNGYGIFGALGETVFLK